MTRQTTTRGERYAHRLGIEIIGQQGHDLKAACAGCGSSDAFRIHQDDCTTHCYRCDHGASPLQYAEQVLGGRPQAIDLLVELGLMEDHGNHHNNGAVDLIDRVAKAKGVSAESLKAYGATIDKRLKKDKSGTFSVVRVPAYNENGEAHSYFDLTTKGKGLFREGKGMSGLFLPGGRKPQAGESWLVVEGVKDAAAAHGMGYLAVGLPNNKLAQKFVTLFRGVDVVIIPDRDTAGEQGAEITAARLFKVAASVKVATLPAEFRDKSGADLRDALKNGEELVRKAIDDAEPWKPADTTDLQNQNGCEIPSIRMAEGRTDKANAARFIKRHGGNIHWVADWNKFVAWNGRHWEHDRTCRATDLAKQVAHALWMEVARLVPLSEKEDVKVMSSFAKSSSSAKGAKDMLELAKPDIAVLPEVFDRHDGERAFLFCCENGVIDLRTGKLRPHRREDMITKMAPTVYDPEAACPLWDQHIHDVFDGNDQMMAFAQRAIGYSITADTSERCLFFCFGAGKNGKGTTLETVAAVVGEEMYSTVVDASVLMARKEGQHPTGITDLAGIRFARTNETEEHHKLAESLIKTLTGGCDRIKGRRMRENFWSFDPVHHLWISGNHKPRIKGTDDGVWDRIRLIPFNVRFTEPDKNLPRKLLAERSGILAWIVRGVQQWLEHGLAEPEEVTKATEEYRGEENTLARWIDDRCVVNSGVKAQASQLFSNYLDWASKAGEPHMNQTNFGKQLAEKGYIKEKSGVIWWNGIAINDLRESEE